METIALGVLVVDLRALKVVDEFQRFVRPIIHPRLTAFCKTVTGIRQPEVDQAPAYGVVAAELSEFLERYPSALWSSWGSYEAKQLTMDAARIGCAPLLGGLGHQDIKKWHAKIFGCRAMGLQPAVEALGLSWQGTYHRGIDDAQNLANLVLRVLKDEPDGHCRSDHPRQ
jgi:inhibitor of KinA sporulation pathway (predicted exonuclease)